MFNLISRSKSRHSVNVALAKRPGVPFDWQSYGQSSKARERIVEFVVRHFAAYSGINFDYVLPHDQLQRDLQFSNVCHGDWDLDLYEDLKRELGVDIRAYGSPQSPATVEGWIDHIARCASNVPSGTKE
jgi:hypothetical protein